MSLLGLLEHSGRVKRYAAEEIYVVYPFFLVIWVHFV